MVDLGRLAGLAQEALLLGLTLSVPVLAASLLVSLVVSMLQAATQIQDSSLSHLPRLVVVALVLAFTGPWIGSQVVAFASRAFTGG
ncbi:MAG: flagellar biosynthetic protein FliQ [Polyangiaceae bacterium]|nr:flagellar biosynthetic protein FliQ [Polyangiaceae bacterium]